MVFGARQQESGADPYESGAAAAPESDLIASYHFPAEMIGGSCPHVKGEEEALVWNAAAEACASERIHFIWRAHEGRLWYLAIRSADLASESGKWCPFASLLPGQSDALPAPVIYVHHSDEVSTLMVVDKDSLQIIRGTSSVIKAKAERLSRDMGNAQIVDMVPDRIVTLKAVMWDSLSMLENRARRFFTILSFASAILVIVLSAFVWFMASVAQMAYKADLKDLQARTSASVMQLQQTAQVLRTSEMREQIAAFTRLNENLITVQGWLKLYFMQGTNLRWWAVVPPNLTSDRIQELGAQTVETNDEGLVVANGKESYQRKGALKLQ